MAWMAGTSPAITSRRLALGDGMSIPISENFAPKRLAESPAAETPKSRLLTSSRLLSGHVPAWLQVAPFAAVFFVFFLVPLALTVMVSFWDYNEYQILPAFTVRSYVEIFEGCRDRLPDLCVTLKTYLSTLKFCVAVWLITLMVGFFIAYFLAFHVKSTTLQIALFLVCTIPFWTSNVIRTISWIPLLGRNGLVNSALLKLGIIHAPIEWLIFS